MRKSAISLALSDISDEFLLEAAQPKRRSPALPILAAAACVCLVLLGAFALRERGSSGIAPQPPISGELTVTIPLVDKNIGNPVNEACMVAFFIYEGRFYESYDAAPIALRGDKLGTVSGSINERSSLTDYAELSGSIGGDFYAVEGYDPRFLLCKDLSDGEVMLYINNRGITVHKGAELFDEGFRLTGSYAAVKGLSRNDWFYNTGNFTDLTAHRDVLDTFLAALNEGTFIRTQDILPDGADNVYDSLESHHLYFTKPDGVKVHLRLLDGGYVQPDRFREVCVQMDKAAFDAVTALME